MIREASIYALKRLSSEERSLYGLRVLTTRKWLRGVRKEDIDVWLPSAGPSIEVLQAWHAGKASWRDFLVIYQMAQEMQQSCRAISYSSDGQRSEQEHPVSSITYLRELEHEQGTITLLCWETGPHCHRHTLKALVEGTLTPMINI